MRFAIVGFLAAGWALAQEPAPRIDKLFARFAGRNPGCALGVVQSGKAVFTKAYGMADLEHDVPLTIDSPFYMASVSKQITALSVLLLAEDGKLQLSDSIRKTVPELPQYADKVTLYHLLTHTSGIRDYFALSSLAGRPMDFVHTDGSVLRLLSRQASLNYEPGAEFLYSNSGYVLLSIVVKRVAQKDLNDFAHERLFGPLGMKSTRFQHDHSAIVPGKAFGYQRQEDGWHAANSLLDVVGDGGLYSTVTDMIRWLINLDHPKIGAKGLAIMQTPAKLGDGTAIRYGMGLTTGEYRGLRTVEHNGGLAGYRTEVLWFPAQEFSVVCLCNNGSANPTLLARQTADIYLASHMKPVDHSRSNLSGVELNRGEVHAKAGLYRNQDGAYIEIAEKEGKLYLRAPPNELIAIDHHRFTGRNAAPGWEVDFDEFNPPGHFDVRSADQPPLRYDRIEPVKLTGDEMKAYAGEYASRELETTYRIIPSANALWVERGDAPKIKLRNIGEGRMRIESIGAELFFARDTSGRITGFSLNAGPIRHIRFVRLE